MYPTQSQVAGTPSTPSGCHHAALGTGTDCVEHFVLTRAVSVSTQGSGGTSGGHLAQAGPLAQAHVQPGFEYLQGGRLHNLKSWEGTHAYPKATHMRSSETHSQCEGCIHMWVVEEITWNGCLHADGKTGKSRSIQTSNGSVISHMSHCWPASASFYLSTRPKYPQTFNAPYSCSVKKNSS